MTGMEKPPGRIVVIGIGSRFRRDDGVGRAVVSRMEQSRHQLPDGTQLHISDGDPARLVSLWENTALAVVVDAARAVPRKAGRVHRLETGFAHPIPEGITASSHGLGLRDAVALAAALDLLPSRLVVYAVEAADTGFGGGLSRPVAGAVRGVVEAVVRDIGAAVASQATRAPERPGAGGLHAAELGRTPPLPGATACPRPGRAGGERPCGATVVSSASATRNRKVSPGTAATCSSTQHR